MHKEKGGMQKNIAVIENNIIATNTIRGKFTRVLMEKGYNVTILSTGSSTDLRLAKDNGFRVIDVKGSTQNPVDILRYMQNLRRALI
ncbi:MAG TPA: hypothetical protein VK498_05080, partial [Ferruginibacter sp.]|nr:hypothetical protein [Ferruginibacter sp.]